jgi:5'(3')-deoxyribonucleotidase
MIYLDLDGPFVNWTKGVFDLFGEELTPEVFKDIDVNAAEALGVKKSEIWARISRAGHKWWAELEPHPWSRFFFEELSRIDEVIILSSPSHIPAGSSGKVKWMKNFFGGNFRQYILTSRKDLLAKPGDVLIDDINKNVDAFNQNGGNGILFPRPWNRSKKDSHRPVEKVLYTLSKLYPRYNRERESVRNHELETY